MCARIHGWENLRLAHRKAARGKRGKQAAAAFEYNLADRLLELQSPGKRGAESCAGTGCIPRGARG